MGVGVADFCYVGSARRTVGVWRGVDAEKNYADYDDCYYGFVVAVEERTAAAVAAEIVA